MYQQSTVVQSFPVQSFAPQYQPTGHVSMGVHLFAPAVNMPMNQGINQPINQANNQPINPQMYAQPVVYAVPNQTYQIPANVQFVIPPTQFQQQPQNYQQARVPAPNNYHQGVNNPINSAVRKIKYDPDAKSTGETMIMDQIMKSLKAQNREMDIDMSILANGLTNLNPRMTKTVMEMISDYHVANPNNVQIMGRKDGAPYGGIYRNDANETEFDLKHFPDSLIMILNEFITLMKTHANTQPTGKGVYHNGVAPRYGNRKQ